MRNGLVVDPDMQVSGNGSSGSVLRWFSDRRAETLPDASFVSVPLFVFRALMFLWALRKLARVSRLAGVAWARFSEHGLMRPFDYRPWHWFR